MWSCSNIKSQVYQALTRYQKVNHFPKSTEITRKDCMYRLLARMREFHGAKHYGFVPLTFILPNELAELQEAMAVDPQKQWIVKPASSSQGKGIFLTTTTQDVRLTNSWWFLISCLDTSKISYDCKLVSS
jgi:tubulin polyglutamylase TTLL5